MAGRYLNVESLDGVVVRCEVLEWDARGYADDGTTRHSLVLRPDNGEIVLVFHRVHKPVAMVSTYDPHENRHERGWPRLARRLARHTNRSK